MVKTIIKVSIAVVNADHSSGQEILFICIGVFSSLFLNGSSWSFFFFFSGADVGAVAKTSHCQSCKVWFWTDYFDNHKFGRNIATGKSCRTFLATTSKLLPPVFSFSSSHVKLKMDHNLFLLHMRSSREPQAPTIIKWFELEDKGQICEADL